MMLPSNASFLMVPFNVDLGLPCFLLPDGVQCHASLGILLGSMRRAWPKYLHRLIFIVLTMSSVSALSKTSSLVIKSFDFIFRRRLRTYTTLNIHLSPYREKWPIPI